MKLDALPENVLERILSYITSSGRHSLYSPVCPRWRNILEPRIFRELKIQDTDFDDLERNITGARRSYVKTLDVLINLPTYTDDDGSFYEEDKDREANNRVATEQTTRLASILGIWDFDAPPWITLALGFRSPSDLKEWDDRPTGHLGPVRYESSSITIDNAASLPFMRCVAVFRRETTGATRSIDLVTLAQMTLRMPRIRTVEWQADEGDIWTGLRVNLRVMLASLAKSPPEGIKWALPPSADSLEVRILGVPRWKLGHCQRLPDVRAGFEYDPLCVGLRRLSTTVRKFEFQGMVDPSLFWPADSENDEGGKVDKEPLWPELTELDIEAAPESPSGRYYLTARPKAKFTRPDADEPLPRDMQVHFPPGYGEWDSWDEALEYKADMTKNENLYDEHNKSLSTGQRWFRNWPNNTMVLPLLGAFLKALTRMPKLKSAVVRWDVEYGGLYFAYAAPGEVAHEGGDVNLEDARGGPVSVMSPKFLVHGLGWKLSEETEELVRGIGREYHGEDTAIRYVPDICCFMETLQRRERCSGFET